MQVTLDLLEEEGYTYCMDWGSLDDQPVWMKTRSGGKILGVPYALELNDYTAFFTRSLSHANYADTIIDSFDEMLSLTKVRLTPSSDPDLSVPTSVPLANAMQRASNCDYIILQL